MVLTAIEYGTSGASASNSTSGASVGSTCTFYDVTLGDMDVNCLGSHNCLLDGATDGVLSASDSSYAPAYGTSTRLGLCYGNWHG
ncbi:MAG TPA: hypothetical protein VMH03_04045 [Terriglobales bacterium]|nr:hypothetical protein [Terriglobales bacterium]